MMCVVKCHEAKARDMWPSRARKPDLLAGCRLRRRPTFSDATTGFPTKWRLRNERKNSILMTRHYPDLNEPCFFALLQFAACLKGVHVGLNKPHFPVNIKNLVTFSAAELSSNLWTTVVSILPQEWCQICVQTPSSRQNIRACQCLMQSNHGCFTDYLQLI